MISTEHRIQLLGVTDVRMVVLKSELVGNMAYSAYLDSLVFVACDIMTLISHLS